MALLDEMFRELPETNRNSLEYGRELTERGTRERPFDSAFSPELETRGIRRSSRIVRRHRIRRPRTSVYQPPYASTTYWSLQPDLDQNSSDTTSQDGTVEGDDETTLMESGPVRQNQSQQPSLPACAASPCEVGPCLTHFLKEARTIPGGQLVPGVHKLCPQIMNPGFIDPKTDSVNKEPSLQTALENLLDTKYKRLKSKIAVAVVDLTGPSKQFAPEFAGWHESEQLFGASVPKIAPLFAVFQLQQDLQTLANRARISAKGDLINEAAKRWEQEGLKRTSQPKIERLFTFQEDPPKPVEVKIGSNLADLLCCAFHFSCNRSATILIDLVGFPYLSSVLWQSGLFHKKRGGLWLQSGYGLKQESDCERKCDSTGSTKCNHVLVRYQPASPVIVMPLKRLGFRQFSSQNVSALSAATYLTLLAQRRLAGSVAIQELLAHACSFFAADTGPDEKYPNSVCKKLGYSDDALQLERSAQKCGFNPKPQATHDCVLLTRLEKGKRLRYVVVLFTSNATDDAGRPLAHQAGVCFFRNRFLIDIDKIIQGRNP